MAYKLQNDITAANNIKNHKIKKVRNGLKLTIKGVKIYKLIK